MLIVSNRPNGGYKGKCKDEATRLVKAGTRVGMCHLSGEENKFFCHVCNKEQPLPVAFKTGEKIDELKPCPGCNTIFVFAEI